MPEAHRAQLAHELQALLEENFAPWVRDLDLTVRDATAQSVTLIMRPGERLNRQGAIVSGQALMAAADTVMVLGIFAHAGRMVPCATVDMHTCFLKPATNVELHATSSVVRVGRSIAFMRAEVVSTADRKAVVTATGTYALPALGA